VFQLFGLYTQQLFSKTLEHPTRKSSRPLKCPVCAYPIGSRQLGQAFSNPPSPSYHFVMQLLHPNKTLQHLLAITGGFIGVVRHILHLKESWTSFARPSGISILLLTERISATDSLSSNTSLAIVLTSFSKFLKTFDFWALPSSSSAFLLWLGMRIAYNFRLGHFQKATPAM